MNILTEQQAVTRGLRLVPEGLLRESSPEFLAGLQARGMFVEYNQQVVVAAGQPVEYLFCIISGRATISQPDQDFGRKRVATLKVGQWFGEMGLFLQSPSLQEVRAEGELIAWAISPDTLRALFFENPAAVMLLYNFGVILARQLAAKGILDVPASIASS